jgi:hypothetical protein
LSWRRRWHRYCNTDRVGGGYGRHAKQPDLRWGDLEVTSNMKSPPGVHRMTSRRDVLGGMLAAGAALAEARPARASGSLTFVSYGGSYGDSVEKYLLAPFRQKTGIAVSLGVNSTLAGL